MTQPVLYSCSNRPVSGGVRWVRGDACRTWQELPSAELPSETVRCAFSQADSWVKFTGGAPCRRQPALPASGRPGRWSRKGKYKRKRQRALCAASRTPGTTMARAVRWSGPSAGWLWIFGAALGQCLGYSSQQQRVVFPQPPGQSHLQASYVEFKPSQVTSLLNFGLGWEWVSSFVTF